jgi:hypothetical protein
LSQILSFQIYNTVDALPKNWNDFATKNVFLSSRYLQILDDSAPNNMKCCYIGLFSGEKLVGIAVSQLICLAQIASFGANKSCLQSKIRDFAIRQFANNVLVIGNNMLTGQNAFCFSDEINFQEGLSALCDAVLEMKQNYKKAGQKIHLTIFKDFAASDEGNFKIDSFSNYHQFSVQPNMVFDVLQNWHSAEDYVGALSKKYRDQYKRARKKADGIVKRKLSLEEIIIHNQKIYELYLNVTKNAPFNTFYLNQNHFIDFKKKLDHDFLFYGYFIDDVLIGFNTLIKNGTTIDTYFLGYDDNFQKNNMLYLNMLYDMIGYSINKKYKKIVFARTALEIKSSVGATPEMVFGFLKHNNKLVNKLMPKLLNYFEPKVVWQERNPFRS